MGQRNRLYCISIITLFVLIVFATALAAKNNTCNHRIQKCLLTDLQAAISLIDDQTWADRARREFAKTQATLGDADVAMQAAGKIKNPDTRAMAIRGIAIAVAESERNAPVKHRLFSKLMARADAIAHPPSRFIALTYIAKARAIAGYDNKAYATAAGIENPDMRNKAYGAIAQAQANSGRINALTISLGKIDDNGYRNRQRKTTAKILARNNNMKAARRIAATIEGNALLKAKALQTLLNKMMKQSK